MRIYLIRHPPVAVPAGVCYGATDLMLAQPVAACAARLKAILPAGLPLFTSPLRRCRVLADALHPTPRPDHRLREMNFGEWEMRPWSDIPRGEIDAWAAAPLDYVPPGGESVAQVAARVEDFLDECRARGMSEFAVVTHGGVMKVIAGRSANLQPAKWMGLRFGHAEVHVVEARAGGR